MTAADPDAALAGVAESLREPATVITPHVREPDPTPVLGRLAAAGPRTERAPGEYAQVVESVLEGYLLHHGVPRIMSGHDGDLALLAGDYLYALGLEQLALMEDAEAVLQLADLISLAAEAHAEGLEEALAPLWLTAAVAVGCGESSPIAEAKEALRKRNSGAATALARAAEETADGSGIGSAFRVAAKAIDFPAVEGSSLD